MFAAQQNCRKVYNSSFPERIETTFVSTESLELIALARVAKAMRNSGYSSTWRLHALITVNNGYKKCRNH